MAAQKLLPLLILFQTACTHLPDKVMLSSLTDMPNQLSELGFFKSPLHLLEPNDGVIEYSLVNEMFNDYAKKKSFVYLPSGSKAEVDSNGQVLMPVGGCFINCVYYPNDERDSTKGIQLIETQILVRKSQKWEAYNYVWNDSQSDATLENLGKEKQISFIKHSGITMKVNFMISSKNQCKGCHNTNSALVPIGFSNVRQIAFTQSITGLFKDETSVSSFMPHVSWIDKSQTLEQRVRAYMHINCAHCHNENGPAKMSGLYLTYDNHNMEAYGVCKSPPSSGKGNCNLLYDIVPGNPGQSIIVCRMASNDLETKMPELGRTTVHTEAVGLIVEWIASMSSSECKVEELDR